MPLRTKGTIVLGMHRSGTSCLTGLLETAGLWLGDVPRQNKHNAKGNLESQAVRLVNQAILAQFGGSWMRPPREVRWREIDPRPVRRALEPYRRRDGWLVKDPRLVLTLEAWLPHAPVHQMIGTFRHPISVARSLERRNGMGLEDGVALWTRYNRRLIELHLRHRFPLLSFDLDGGDYIEQFHTLCRRIGLEFDPGAVGGFYESRLVSQKTGGFAGLAGEAAEVYVYLVQNQLDSCLIGR